MTNLKTRLAVLLLCTFCSLTGAFGQFTPVGDSYTDTAFPGHAYGTKEILTVSNGAAGSKRVQTTFIQFNLSEIPSTYTGANVAKASLKLYVTNVSTPGSFNVDYVNGPWSENTIDYNNAPSYGSTISANISLGPADTNQYILVDITAAVQAWLDGTPDYGIALVANDPTYAVFESKENTSTSHPPELDIVFASGIGTITGVTTANGSGLTGGGTSGSLNLGLTPCPNGQVLASNGPGWTCSTVSGGAGTVTTVGSGTGLTGGPITTSGTLAIDPNVVPLLSLENQFTASQSVLGSLTATYLGASGAITAGGGAVFPSTGNSPTSGSPSSPLDLTASASNGTTASYQTFRWQAANVDGGAPSANLNLLFGAAGATPQPTGLSIAPNGIISFASGQTFGGGGGGGITSVTGINGVNAVTSGGAVTLNADRNVVAFQSDLTAGITTAETTAENYASANFLPLTAASSFATIGANTFTGNQTITGNLTASGNVGIGTTTPQATLDVNGSINLPNTTSSTIGVLSVGGAPFLSNYPGTSGSANTFVGLNAGNSNGTNIGGDNSAFGNSALLANTSGNQNSAFGNTALFANTSGSFNSAFGVNSLSRNAQGSNNSAFGTAALVNLNGGNQNIAVGWEAGISLRAAESNNIYIGNPGVTGESNIIRIGDPTVQTATYIAGSLNFPDGTKQTTAYTGGGGGGGGSGTVTSVAAGAGLLASPSPITTSGTLSINTAVVPQLGTANNFVGNQSVTGNISATGEISTNGLIFAGSMSTFGTMNAGSYSLGGTSVLAHAPSTGGSLLLGENTGNSTLLSSLDISSTTAIGDNTLRFYTGGNYNTALGNSALYEATSGSNNTGAGYEALYHNTSGSDNTAMGYNAGNPSGFQNTTGSNNTFLGANSGVGNQTALNYATAIGANAVVSQPNSLVLGSIANLNGCSPTATPACLSTSVGIGTATPNATLDVEAPSGTTPTVVFGSASNQAAFTVNGNLNVTGTLTCGSGCSGGGGGGSITNVIAGTDLTGGGTGPTVTLNLNTSATDLRYSQLGATNTFTGTQTINTTTGNGIFATSSGAYGVFGQSLGSTGAGVFGTGIGSGVTGSTSSPTGSGVVATNFATSGNAYGLYAQSSSSPSGMGVYGTGSAAGVYGVAASSTGTGVVGVSNAGWAGFFQGSVNITNNLSVVNNAQVLGNLSVTGNTVSGTLSVGGDTPMSHNPRMVFSGFMAGDLGNSPFGGFFIPDNDIIVTRITASMTNGGWACETSDSYAQLVNANNQAIIYYSLDLQSTGAPTTLSSPALSVVIPAGTNVLIQGTAATGCALGGHSPSNVFVNVQYVMK